MLKRLRVKGFKSFADPIDLEFGPGINVIVGPNGSGKSNISEAIAWALGEQRAGKLRAPAMQDILFSGGDGRQPVGMAEVSITLDGPVTEGPAELGVTRRLTRAGDSGYKLNNGNCRLVDVLDSLSSRGLGPQSLSIIRQGQVDQICQSKPAAMRAILDEAAGTGLPKRRRHRAELRLKHVDDHLARARDLAGEIASRARSLERQARAAGRAAEVEKELTEAREALATARAVGAGRALAAAHEARTARATEVTVATQALEAARMPGPKRLGVSVEMAGDDMMIRLADNGPGVPAELRERVFEPFFTTKPPEKGTGVGLALCRALARAHGGSLNLEDTPGGGASFILRLPLR